MSATIQWAGVEATIDGYEWVCEDEDVLALLNGFLDEEGPSGGDPEPDLHVAERVVQAWGAELVRFDESEYVRGRVY